MAYLAKKKEFKNSYIFHNLKGSIFLIPNIPYSLPTTSSMSHNIISNDYPILAPEWPE